MLICSVRGLAIYLDYQRITAIKEWSKKVLSWHIAHEIKIALPVKVCVVLSSSGSSTVKKGEEEKSVTEID